MSIGCRVGLAHHDEDPAVRFIAPVIHHLRPLKTYSSPSRTMDSSMFVASEDATSVPEEGGLIADRRRATLSTQLEALPCASVMVWVGVLVAAS